MENKLAKWFDAAKRVEPVMSIEEVEAMISQSPKGGFSTLQKNTIMGTLLSAIIGCLLWYMMPQQTQHEYSTLVETTKQTASSERTTEQAVQMVVQPNRTPNSTVWVKKDIPAQEIDLGNTISESTNIVKIEPLIAPQSNSVIQPEANGSFNDNKLYLSNEELAQLGIMTDGNTLYYRNITGEVSKATNDEGLLITPYFSLKVSRYGSQRELTSNWSADSIIERSKSFWPAAIQTVSNPEKDSSMKLLQNFVGNGYEQDYFNEVKQYLIPVVVNTQSQPSRYSHDLEMIFWFKPEASFFAALPSSLSDEVQKAYPPIQLDKFKEVNAKFVQQYGSKFNLKGFDAERIKQLNAKAIELTPAEYKKLNVKPTKTGFIYTNKFKQFAKVHDLRIEQKEIGIIIAADGYSLFPKRVSKGDKPFTPVALTDLNFQRVSYFYVYPDSITHGKRESLNQERFQSEVDKLVPIKVSDIFILWFPLTDDLLKALPERYRE